jgi:hypothetical protein
MRLFFSQFSLKNFFDNRSSRQEVLRAYTGTYERILLEKCLNLRSQSEGGRPHEEGHYMKDPGSESLQPGFDLRQLVSIILECVYQLVMDLFRSPSFHPEKPDGKSLFLFLHLSSLTDFVNHPN